MARQASSPQKAQPASRRGARGASLQRYGNVVGQRHLSEQSTRQCRICRTPRQPSDILALTPRLIGTFADAEPQGLRHAYVCIGHACLARLDKVLGCSSGTERWLDALTSMGFARVRESLGLARRQGDLVPGAARLPDGDAPSQSVIVVAEDAASRTYHQLQNHFSKVWRTPWSQITLGASVGLGPLAAAAIRPSRHATQAAYWLRVCYEAQPTAGQMNDTHATDDGIEVVR